MQVAVYISFLLVCIVPWFITLGYLPRQGNFGLELYCACIALFVIAEGIRTRFEFLRTSYVLVFGAVVVVMICGILLNELEAGPIVSGIRNYFRYIPFFFVGAVYSFSEAQIRRQLILLAAICVFQVPVAIYQILHEIESASYWDTAGISGDVTMGTMQGASTLSMFLAMAISVLVALQRRGEIPMRKMLVLFLLFVIPTTINETRATFIILPTALLVTGFVLAKPGQRARNVVVTLFIILIFAAIFIPIYDYLIQQRDYGATMWDFFTTEGRAEGYFDRKVGVGAQGGPEAGRLEMITVPVEYLSRDPLKLLFGLGIGNASPSSLGQGFTGEYYVLFRQFLAMTFSRVVLELGLLGVGLMLTLLWMIFKDARTVAAREEGMMGALAAGWTGATVVAFIGFFYKDLVIIEQIAVPYFFYSGVVAAHAMRMEAREREARRVAARRARPAPGVRHARTG